MTITTYGTVSDCGGKPLPKSQILKMPPNAQKWLSKFKNLKYSNNVSYVYKKNQIWHFWGIFAIFHYIKKLFLLYSENDETFDYINLRN